MVVGLVAGLLVLSSDRSLASCSCDFAPADVKLDVSDGAFIGSLVQQRDVASDQNGGFSSNLREVVSTFEVTEWVKGDLELGLVDVTSGGGCGLGSVPDLEIAVYLRIDQGKLTSSSCSSGSAAELRAHLRPAPVSDGPGVFLAGQTVLDANGHVVARPPRPGAVGHVPCGGTRFVHLENDEVVVTDLATWTELERMQWRRSTRWLRCSGDHIVAVAGPRGERQVWDVRTREAITGPSGLKADADLRGDTLVANLAANDQFPPGVRAIDLTTGEQRLLQERRPLDGLYPNFIRGVEISPDGTRAVFTMVSGEGRDEVSEVFVASLDGSTLIGRHVEDDGGRTIWLDDDLLLFRVGRGQGMILDARDLSVVTDLGDQNVHWVAGLHDGYLVGAAGAEVRRMALTGGDIERLSEVGGVDTLQILDDPVTFAESAARPPGIDTPIASPRLEAVADVRPVAAAQVVSQADEGTERTWLGWASSFVGIIVVLGALYGLAAWLRRKRGS